MSQIRENFFHGESNAGSCGGRQHGRCCSGRPRLGGCFGRAGKQLLRVYRIDPQDHYGVSLRQAPVLVPGSHQSAVVIDTASLLSFAVTATFDDDLSVHARTCRAHKDTRST